jgi:putative Ca2+/H+ antiporter (TMEM165/GDT1 family)
MFKIIFTTFWVVLIAELGDKTQLQTMLLATQNHSKLSVFIGASSALVFSAFLGVTAGSYITKYIPTCYLQIGAGVSFIIIGLLTILGRI